MDTDMDEIFINFCELHRLYKSYKNLKSRREKVVPKKKLNRPTFGMGADQMFQHTRMTHPTFNKLLQLVSRPLRKPKQKIYPEERLSVTLQYLAQGSSMQTIAAKYNFEKKTVRLIVLETCEVIWRILSTKYVAQPTEKDYQSIANDFMDMWNIPNCVGAIDGKRIAIKFPSDPDEMIRKQFFSIYLIAACDAKHIFTAVSVGEYSNLSDDAFQHSSFGQAFIQNTLPLPPPVPLSNATSKPFPHYFVGNSAFPLRKILMRPYHGEEITKTKQIYNYRLSHAHKAIENSLGVLIARWRVLNTEIEGNPKNCETIVLACIALHNFIMRNDPYGLYCPKNYVDRVEKGKIITIGNWRRELNNTRSLPSVRSVVCRDAFQLRETLANYFINEGALPYQDKWMI
ncbi:putative nuclease HARBI1 isoform X2 [Eurosta solidaginis]|uniref:putative nuclease HARBI1 isoform X2 n=1 Tax=Eurosta solidaginis TaxID=178769 RepID=UPI0035306334